MPNLATTASNVSPKLAIRRFDVLAEYTRQERREKGYPADEAKGYGIWLAKVVASRRFGQGSGEDHGKPARQKEGEQEPKFRSLSGELQTDATFDHDIIDRMGTKFYDEVFVPAITRAREEGEKYEAISDSIRRGWKPAR